LKLFTATKFLGLTELTSFLFPLRFGAFRIQSKNQSTNNENQKPETDAAHPQTPFLGQGVNMAICDAYVYATNLAMALQCETKSVQKAVADCDTDARRKQAKRVIQYARDTCNYTTSTNFLTVWMMKLFSRFAPISEIMKLDDKSDASNKNYLANLDDNHCSVKEQEALRRPEP